jgi:hypothetical protein
METTGARKRPLELTAADSAVLDCYFSLSAALTEHGEDLAPFARRNATKALGALWQVANGLGADPGNRYDIGV